MKTGIILVTFGSTAPRMQAALARLHDRAAALFPSVEIRWAFTSPRMRRERAQQGHPAESPETALRGMQEAGYRHVAVQSLHVTAGAEYHALGEEVRRFRSGPAAFERISLGAPLLLRRTDLDRVVRSVLAALPTRKPGDAIVLMGHGNSQGRGDMAHLAAAAAFREADPAAFLGTLQGQPTLQGVLAQLKAAKARRAVLVPFLSLVGTHARRDLAGDGPGSWRSAISALGIECVPCLKGLVEIDRVVDVWLDHLEEAMANDERPKSERSPKSK